MSYDFRPVCAPADAPDARHGPRTRAGQWGVRLAALVTVVTLLGPAACARGEGTADAATPPTDVPARVQEGGQPVGQPVAAVGDLPRDALPGQVTGGEVAEATALKRQALGALRSGDFDTTAGLLSDALRLAPDDKTLRQMGAWVADFQGQRQEFLAQRQRDFDRHVRDVELLEENNFHAHALGPATTAYLLTPEGEPREALRAQPWLQTLITDSAELGHKYEEQGKWLKAVIVWGNLATIEDLNPEWKSRQRAAFRRVRMLATYAPDAVDAMRESLQAERDAADRLLREDRAREKGQEVAAEAPEEVADVDAVEALDDTFRSDWRDQVAGVRMDMLRDALVDAQRYHVRDVTLKQMLVGGLDAVEALATTNGLEAAFPTLADDATRQRFVSLLREQRQSVGRTDPAAVNRRVVTDLLSAVVKVNRQTLDLPEEVLVSEMADGALGSLDPYTGMIWPSQLAEFSKMTQGEFVGVGIQIRGEDNGDLRVVSPLPGTPAYEAGVQPNDVITHIDGKSARGINDQQAVRVITGQPETKVTLTIRSIDGTVRNLDLVRRPINIDSVRGWTRASGGSWNYLIDPEQQVGYLRLTNFQKSTGEELAASVEDARRDGARGLIIDLRNNPGGLLQAAVEVSDRFLPDALVVSTRGERQVVDPTVHTSRRRSTDVDLPIVILVNEFSASASEIVGGALQDNSRALVVGRRTFGKGSVQMLYRLGRGDAYLKLTTSHYYLPSGRNIHKDDFDTEWGVDPDVPVDMSVEQMRNAAFARQALDVLREDPNERVTVELGEDKVETDAREALLRNDTQLSAALLLMRMQLAGHRVM